MNTPLSHKSVILHFEMKNHTKVDYVKKVFNHEAR